MVANGGQDNFLILGPGESVNVDHNCMYAQDRWCGFAQVDNIFSVKGV